MKNDLGSPGQILTAALLPAIIVGLLCALLLWEGWDWRSGAVSARSVATHDRREAADTQKRVDFLKTNKDRVDDMWMHLSAGAVRVTPNGGVAGFAAPAGPSVNLSDVPLNRGAAFSSGLSIGTGRPRDLPEALAALADADFLITQPASNDKNFRFYGLGSEKIEIGRLLPLIASVESRYPLALIEEAVFTLPASQEAFDPKASALESRLVMRLPVYDATKRQRDAHNKQKPGAPAGAPAPSKS